MHKIYTNGRSFESFMQAIDELLIKKLGVTSADLPDRCYADYFDDGLRARDVVEEILEGSEE